MILAKGIAAIILFIFVAYLFSADKKAINKRTVLVALGLNIGFAFLVLAYPPGNEALAAASKKVSAVLHYGSAGINFLFGNLNKLEGVGFIFAFKALPMIIFVSALLSILYHFGVMQLIIKLLGGGVGWLLKVSKIEGVVSAANIFNGMSTSTLVAKPYIDKITKSEMFTIVTVGLASVGADVLIGYVMMGIPMEYLLAAIFMCVPSSILMAKILYPETEEIAYVIDDKGLDGSGQPKAVNFVAAAASGAKQGMSIYLAVFAMLMAFISLVAMFNGFLSWLGGFAGYPELSFEMITGWIIAPIAWLIGADWADAPTVGALIGTKTIINEFVAYGQLGPMLGKGVMAAHSEVVAIFALCGFANIGSVAILVGVIGELAPQRQAWVAQFGFRALLAATLANLLNAAVAGTVVMLVS